MNILLECIAVNLEDAAAIEAGGGDRIELCSAMALGGLTPGYGSVSLICSRIDLPVMVMIRPREGGMCYSPGELEAMERDIAAAAAAGAGGIVFGVLTPDGRIDLAACERLVDRARAAGGDEFQLVFHRAFDVTPDPSEALEQLIDLDFDRVLTSGQQARAMEGLPLIRSLHEQAAGRIEILPGGGIRAGDAARLVQETGVNQVHMYPARPARDISASRNPQVRFGTHLPEDEQSLVTVDGAIVREVRRELEAL